ncbi:fungal-specific transcription factor domain-containing protein [Irpex rosettiformis]|uniref:Fungal-specific transcription factor domain-containing protein n=1 Tax=Irpex rosettiformis TaxID=378272 RepID=A0ACB8UKU3_9APHY|nr:fungal-specific transcription factor domain-containing protein [Irpex rosettiformis]
MDNIPGDFVYLPSPLHYDPGINLTRNQQQHLRPFSDEDMCEPGPSSSKLPRRGTRACDRCRKIKSKCEGTEGERCKNCQAAGTACTFQGPSFKRGPPKGYIHAIEQRWHQVECVLATVMSLPRAQDIISDLRVDPFARDILDRVASGPYGSVGVPSANPIVPGEDGFYNTIMGQANPEDRRTKRQSRQTREYVSSQDSTKFALPTAEWQDQLYRRLASVQGHRGSGIASPYSATSSSDQARFPSYSTPSGQPSPVAIAPHMGYSEQPHSRRRLESSLPTTVPGSDQGSPHFFLEKESIPRDAEEFDEATDTFGHLSVDQNHEFRYHGRSAGLHLLAKSDRNDDSQARVNGIWKFDIPKMEAGCQCLSFDKVNEEIELPDYATQDQLIMAYFSYVHHIFPVVHKANFLAMYHERTLDAPNKAVKNGRKRQPMQTVTKLLLMAMFAFAAHYLPPPEGKKPCEVGNIYALKARRLLNTQYEDSKPSMCQALLLLGLREFGNGCISQGWMYTGMGCRMAIDLGLNRDAENWKDENGQDLFSPIEKQIRRQIWWSCCISDKICSTWLGRPVTFKKGDFSTAEPDFDLNDDEELWRPYPRDLLGQEFDPMAARVMVCFKEQCRLSFIICEIMVKLYPVRLFDDGVNQQAWRDELENALQQWLIDLPKELHYREGVNKVLVPPHVIMTHIEYHAAVLLLHRAFLPNWKDNQKAHTEKDFDAAHNRCLDICVAAAAKISSLIESFDTIYSLTRAPPLLLSYLQSAGIMHVVALTRRPKDTQATIGLLQSIRATEVLEEVWPEASRIRSLLKGAHVEMDDIAALNQSTDKRLKRGLDEALSEDKTADLLFNVQSQYNTFAGQDLPSTSSSADAMSYIPGHEWWPQLVGPGTIGNWDLGMQDYRAYQAPPFVPSQGLFAFDQGHLSTGFNVDQSSSSHHVAPLQSHQGDRVPMFPREHEHHEHHRDYGHHGYPPS